MFETNLPTPAFSEEAQSLEPGIYEHYKKKRYEVMGVARHSETLEEVVVYFDENRELWVRPVSMFCEQVQIDAETSLPRFRKIPT